MAARYAETSLPENYELVRTIDLDKNQKEKNFVTILSLVLLVVVFVLGFVLRSPASVMTAITQPVMLVALPAFLVYLILHEAVHGAFMWYFSKKKPHFGISLQYAYAGSDAYFRRTPYLIIALAPFVIWGLVFGIIALMLDSVWFWLFWFLEAGNASGAAGDLYVFFTVSRMPESILVQDDGISMRIYAPAGYKEA
ncbi:MAG: DUF3267 domain-containing protein [Clostridia bacterium]|nr:DUF3267 domain-containing protein [Clostridia bacterium]